MSMMLQLQTQTSAIAIARDHSAHAVCCRRRYTQQHSLQFYLNRSLVGDSRSVGVSRRAGQHRCTRVRQTRLQATAVADVAQIGQQAGELLAILGIAVGGTFVALWNVEKQSKQSLEREVQAVKEQLQSSEQQVQQLQQQLEAEQKARQESDSWRPRLDEAQKELFKLEKALEMKDAQLATFMTTAHRQIRSLEDNVKQLQKM